ncbi:MAG: alpha/beta hydrolase [Xanthomonadales bacterium]|nr:alpha/beta hydrolase [Xanthomonadales bacterium]
MLRSILPGGRVAPAALPLALLLLFAPCAALALPEENTIEFSNCSLSMPGTPITASARCGFLEVPENPDDPDGRTIRIHVAVGEAGSQTPAQDPLFFFAGGPGQAASETWVMIRSALRKIRKDRDIVMVDQRGTGQSNPLQCRSEELMDLDATLDFEQITREAERCRDSLDADPRFYTTTVAMQDIDAVRRAMGYEQINLMGVSYGTRAAQVYLRQFPDTVRTVVLDSVVPMQLALGQEHAPMLDAAVQKVLADCRQDADCDSRFPNQAGALNALLADLRAQPRELTLTHPVTGEVENLTITAETLAVAIRFLSYASESQAMLPLLIHEAVTTGDLSRLAAQAMMVMDSLTESLSRGMELSVMCSEDYPFLNLAADQSDTILGDIMLRGFEAQCSVWPTGVVPDGFHDPVVSEVPVLLLSGERDPVTPPRYADQAAETFDNSLHLVAEGQSHSVMRHRCLQDVVTDFVNAGTVEDLDTACVDDIAASPFFTTLLGPEP